MRNLLEKAYWNAFTIWHARSEERLPFRPMEEVLAIQSRRVRSIVSHAYDTVPFYRETMNEAGLRPGDFRTAEDLRQLPIVTGEELAQSPERFLSRRHANGATYLLMSSGTQGHVRGKQIHYDTAALFLAMAHGHRQRTVMAHFMGRTFGSREMLAYPPTSQNFLLRDFYDRYSWVPRRLDYTRAALPLEESIEGSVARINQFKPDLLRGMGSYLGGLFRAIWKAGLELHRPRLVMYGGDHMAPADRLLIESEFGVPVLSSYQASEALRLAYQCERREGFHVNLDRFGVRVVDEAGADVPRGQAGAILISDLINRATVLLNYKLGDLVTLGPRGCDCGRTLPVIQRIEGRSDDLIILPDGKPLHSFSLLRHLCQAPGVVQFKLIQEDVRRFTILAVLHPGSDWGLARAGLASALQSVVGIDTEVDVRQVDAIPRETGGKLRAVVSRVQQARD